MSVALSIAAGWTGLSFISAFLYCWWRNGHQDF